MYWQFYCYYFGKDNYLQFKFIKYHIGTTKIQEKLLSLAYKLCKNIHYKNMASDYWNDGNKINLINK